MRRAGASPPLLRAAALAGATLLGACMASPPVHVHRAGAPPAPAHGVHVVIRGENLYRIALEHGLDYRALAAWNGIRDPYVIHPGQRLRLRPPPAGPARVASMPPAPRQQPQRSTPPPPVPSSPDRTGPAQSSSASRTIPEPTPLPPPAPASAPTPAPAQTPAPPPGDGRWQWPVEGRTVRAYSAAHGGNKGVDIAAARGTPVAAAADGTVVYVGDGLKQYGQLVIVKHDDEYLSAYGHLGAALVSEGTAVRRGQPIAHMGGPGEEGLLHFEVRRRGDPINPEGLIRRVSR